MGSIELLESIDVQGEGGTQLDHRQRGDNHRDDSRLGNGHPGNKHLENSEPEAASVARPFIFNQHNLDAYRNSMEQGLALIQKKITENINPFSGVLPSELAEKFQGLDLNQPLRGVGEALAELESLYLNDAVYFHNPKYVAHLNCPVAYPAILAELLLSSINSSVDTWDQSAGATLIEQALIDWSCELIGLGNDADGIFTSGGTQSNLMAMLLARDAYCKKHWPDRPVKESGLPAECSKFRIFTSEMSHFSVQKSAALLGLGYDSVIAVKTDAFFRMDAQALRSQLEICRDQGLLPIAVVATTGTTDFGSIDPLHCIADLCREFDVWLHADAAYGCGLLVSPHRKSKLSGIERADSVTVDYHKSFMQPVSCSAFLVRHKRELDVVTHHAEYLNPLSAQQEGTPNLVNKSLQTTRRFDALKLWLTLRIVGHENLGKMFDEVCDLARASHAILQKDPEIEILHEPEISSLVFRFCPLVTDARVTRMLDDQFLNELNSHIRKAIFRSGEAVVAGTQIYGKRYLKFTLLNPEATLPDIESVISLIKFYGADYLRDHLPECLSEEEVVVDSLVTSSPMSNVEHSTHSPTSFQ